MITTIQVDTKLKASLDKIKVHHRETYNEIIARLLEGSCPEGENKESLTSTIEVLSDPESMRAIAESLEEIQKAAN